ncbi:MAG: Asp23/Gls24 family envelope stress response protein [Limnochordia bacterium]|nr:Asp23/Gls24 family envelope stress response protein [Bacillota bacterium]HOB08439.1 Asp23/Gls24 family envelope stress response protein [Limnochordia bacterium]NLH30283.1 Asp23/Gls24 family envelope stress response protein [Bacillota bacterium]HPT92240.1 Asp23/Gls24 family envelope stress response protein [Limnochordia bacterium]HPZ30888.1 Asp23/Gls24 family envelope stress response protein [Limnochordia bacterium]
MTQKLQTELGSINISEDVIAVICGVAAMECYGLVGMASRNVQDGISDLLRKDYYERGVDVQYIDDHKVSVTLYIIVEYGVRISEVARNIQERVKYAIENTVGLEVESIDIRVQGVRVTDAKRK